MDVWDKVDIELDKEVWYAGETLSGYAVVHNSENVKLNGIRVFLLGKGHTEWRMMRGGDWRVVKDDQKYISDRVTVWPKEVQEGLAILPRGHHKWRLEFQLPQSCLPCSFESKICYIRYSLRIVVDLPFASNPTHMKHFSLIGPYIDAGDPYYRDPRRYEVGYRGCLGSQGCLPWLPCQPRMLSVQLDRWAYCCGESLGLICTVFNGTPRSHWVVVRLEQRVIFYVTGTVLVLDKKVFHTALIYQSAAVKPQQEMVLELDGGQIRIPPMPPTIAVDTCRLLHLTYCLRVLLVEEENKSESDFGIEIPITIATVPSPYCKQAVCGSRGGFSGAAVASSPEEIDALIGYERSISRVEGGKYISTQFRQDGQVYDGSPGTMLEGGEGGAEEGSAFYQPLYVVLRDSTESESS